MFGLPGGAEAGIIGGALGGLGGLIGLLGQKGLDFGGLKDTMGEFSDTAGRRADEVYGYGQQFMKPNSIYYTGALANMGRQTDSMINAMRNQSAVGLGANAYNRMMTNIRRQAMDSTMGQFADLYQRGATNALGMFNASRDFSGQRLGGLQTLGAMKEKEWESSNSNWTNLTKAGFGLLGTFGGSMLGNESLWNNNGTSGMNNGIGNRGSGGALYGGRG